MLDACHPASHLLQTKPASRAAGTRGGDFWELVPSLGATLTCRNLPHSSSRVPAPIPGGSLHLSSASRWETVSASLGVLSSRAAGPRCPDRPAFLSVGPGCAGEGALAWLGEQTRKNPNLIRCTRFNLSVAARDQIM